MHPKIKRLFSLICVTALLSTALPSAGAAGPSVSGRASGMTAGGWFESLYAEILGVTDADVTAVAYSGTMSGSLAGEDFQYLVRDRAGGGVRIDIPGLKAGKYALTVTTKTSTYEATALTVLEHDRSGFAHYKYTEGVGAYNDDGTLKANAKVLYVTDANKNTVTLTVGSTTVTGIGNILNSGGRSGSSPGKTNTNQDILRKLAQAGTPLVVRIIGSVTNGHPTPQAGGIDGLTAYSSTDYGGNVKDNGGMARMQGGHDITIEGIGADAWVDGWGFHFIRSSSDTKNGQGTSFELRNVSFRNVPEDCVGMEGNGQSGDNITAPVERCWVHNCAFYVPKIANPAESDKGEGDGACDFKRGQYMTMDYCYYEGYHKTNLVGSGDEVVQYHITWHHNYWKNCESRGPLGRQANMHIYNCIYENQSSYAMNTRAKCYIFSEYNTFLNCNNPMQITTKDEGSGVGGPIKSFQDKFTNCKGDRHGTIVADKAQEMTDTSNKYANFDTDPGLSYIPSGDYKLDTSVEAAKANIDAYAGVMKPAGEITITHQHIWSGWTTTVSATCTTAGVKSRSCSAEDCPDKTETQPIPALGHNYVDNVCTRCGDKLSGKCYTLTGSEVFSSLAADPVPNMTLGGNSKYPTSYSASAATSGKGGTENFFTLLYGSGSRVDPNEKTFGDQYKGTHRINFQGEAKTTQNAVKFETAGPATVQVWWVGAVAADQITSTKMPRPMVILDAGGNVLQKSQVVNDDATPTISTFTLDEAGVYYLGGGAQDGYSGGKNFIFKVTVTMEDTSGEEGTLGSAQELAWKLTGDGELTVTGPLPAGDMVCAACYNSQGRFTGAKLLTSEKNTAQLGAFSQCKLLWLNSALIPQCPFVTVTPKT